MQVLAPQVRQIQDGDVFRLFTDDPARLPLPQPLLLSLHAVLWQTIGSAGLGESSHKKRKRLQYSAANGDSDDYADDAGRKRIKRGTRRIGKTTDTPRQSGQQPPPAVAREGGSSTQEGGTQVTASVVVSAQDTLPSSGHTSPVASGTTDLWRANRNFMLGKVPGELDLSSNESSIESDDSGNSNDTESDHEQEDYDHWYDHSPIIYHVSQRKSESPCSGDGGSDFDSWLDDEEEELDHTTRNRDLGGDQCEIADVAVSGTGGNDYGSVGLLGWLFCCLGSALKVCARGGVMRSFTRVCRRVG